MSGVISESGGRTVVLLLRECRAYEGRWYNSDSRPLLEGIGCTILRVLGDVYETQLPLGWIAKIPIKDMLTIEDESGKGRIVQNMTPLAPSLHIG